VLYHFLLRYTTRHEHRPEHVGEDAVLDKVCLAVCDADGVRPAVDSPDYDRLVAEARGRVYEARRSAGEG
jgi:hypothetical protein